MGWGGRGWGGLKGCELSELSAFYSSAGCELSFAGCELSSWRLRREVMRSARELRLERVRSCQ